MPDLNMEYLMNHDGDARERTFEGKEATDMRLTATAVAGRLAAVFVCGSHPARGVMDEGLRGQIFFKSITRAGDG
jgi:EIN3-binding F-box protein